MSVNIYATANLAIFSKQKAKIMKIMRDNLSAEPMPAVSGSAHGGEQTASGHLGVSGVTVVGKRMDGDAAAGRKLA